MKKHLTKEQEAKRAERKAKMREFAARVAKMGADERASFAAQCPVVTIEGRMLSPFNQCMIALQDSSASVVGGFRQWIKAGRCVMKGERGLCIWVPIGGKTTDAATGETSIDRQGFMMGTIFDISQTQELEVSAETNEAIVEHSGNLTLV